MKVVHTISSLDKKDGGPSNSVNQICSNLKKVDVQTVIHTLNTPYERVESSNQIVFHDIKLSKKLGFSPSFKRGLLETLTSEDVLHNNGLWMMPNVYPVAAQQKTGCQLMVSPRGTLAQWSLNKSRFKKKIMLGLGQRDLLENADCFHATAEKEYLDIRRFGLTQPVALIPNGIDLPCLELLNRDSQAKHRVLLYLGRVHAQKGIDKLISLWPELSSKHPDWKCIICGPGEESYLQSVQSRINKIGERIHYQAPVYGEDKTRIFAQADLYVLPTETENFGISVAEALAHRVPAIVSKGAPWEGLEKTCSGWWVENNERSYFAALSHAMSLDDRERCAMGESGRSWMQRDFAWATIAKNMAQTYSWLNGKSQKPECVIVD